MLTIKTKVQISSIAGLGLFADESLKKGQFIWKLGNIDYVIPSSVYNLLKDAELSSYLDKYSTENPDGSRLLDGDDCKYMNHSVLPNIIFTKDFGFCAKDISKGEELTCDYRAITTEKHFKELI